MAQEHQANTQERFNDAQREVAKTQQVAQAAEELERAEQVEHEAQAEVEYLERELRGATGSQKRQIEKKLAKSKKTASQAVAAKASKERSLRAQSRSPGANDAEATQLRDELHAREGIIARLEKQKEGLQQEIDRILMEDSDQRVRSLARDNKQLKSEVDRLTTQTDQLRAQIRKIQAARGRTSQSPQPLDQEKEALKKQVEKLNTDLENMRGIIMNGELEGADADQIQKIINMALQPMAESLQTEREARESVEEELAKVRSGERPASGDGTGPGARDMEQKSRDLQKKVKKLVAECELLRAKYKIKHHSFSSSDSQQQQLNKCIDIIKAANARKLSDASPMLTELMDDSRPRTGSSLEEQVEYYHSRLKMSQQQAAKLSADLHGVMDMNDHLSGESSKLQSQAEDFQRKTEQMERKNAKLKSQVARLRDEVRKYVPKFAEAEKSQSPAGEAEESAKAAAREAKSESRGMGNKLQRARADLASSQKVAARLQEQNGELERRLQRLQGEKENLHMQVRDIQRGHDRD